MIKRFFPHSFTWLLYLFFILLLAVTAIVVFVLKLTTTQPNIISVIFVFAGIIFLVYELFVMIVSYKININENMIYSCGDKFPKIEKVQYKCEVNYKDISDVKIIASAKNSKNQQIQLRGLSSSFHKKYLEFTLINDKKERICINHYTKNQVIKILNYISINMINSGNANTVIVDEVMKDWYSYGGYYKQKRKEHSENKKPRK